MIASGEELVTEFAVAAQGSLLGLPTGPATVVRCSVDVKQASAWAYFSKDRCYRYLLGRRWASGGNACLFVLLNPSVADALEPDPTVTRCVGFAKMWGHTEMRIVNLFGFRSSDPKELPEGPLAIGAGNDAVARSEIESARRIVCGWGAAAGTAVADRLRDRARDLFRWPERQGQLSCLGHTKDGHPRHPLYLGKRTPLEDVKATAFWQSEAR